MREKGVLSGTSSVKKVSVIWQELSKNVSFG